MKSLTLAFCVLLAAAAAAEAAEIAGTVVDKSTGEPLAQARVEILESRESTTTDSAGAFALSDPALWPATLVVSHPAYRVLRRRLPSQPGEPLQFELTPVVSFEDRIEVTASRAREGQDPATFTNIPRQLVEETHWGQDPAILLASVAPGYYAYNDNGNGIGYSYFTIRGFGQARARVTLNGAPLNDAESHELFFIDLADFLATAGDIQIRRGVFGLSGIGGALDITTSTPSVEPTFTFHAGGGSFNTQRLSALYDSGLINGTWALTARYSKITTDGYRDQSWVDMWNYYLSLARFGERSSLRFNIFGGPEHTHLAYLGIPKSVLDGGLTGDPDRDRRTNPLSYPDEIDNFFQPHFQIVHALAIAPSTQLDQTFYFFRGEGYFSQYKANRHLKEYNLPDVVLGDGTVIDRTDLVRRRTVDERDAGWVPQFAHTTGQWTLNLGGELRIHEAHHFGDVRWAQYHPPTVPPNNRYYDYQVDKQTYSLTVGGEWRPSARVLLSAGLQETRHRYEMSQDQIKDVSFSETYDFLLPRLGVLVRLAEGTDAYFNVARGMREPTFRTIYDPQDYWGARVSLEPEDVWDFEAGVSLRRRSWRARANVFSMRFDNEIVWAGALDDSGVPIYGNGARSHHRGVELDASFMPSPSFGLDTALTLSRNTFTRYREHTWGGGEEIYDGNRIAGYPDLLASVTARGELRCGRLALTVRRVERFYLNNSEDNRRYPERREKEGYVPLLNPAFTLADLTARVSLPRRIVNALAGRELALELRINNLLDETYTAFGYVDDGEPRFIPAAGRNFYAGVTLTF